MAPGYMNQKFQNTNSKLVPLLLLTAAPASTEGLLGQVLVDVSLLYGYSLKKTRGSRKPDMREEANST